MTFIFYPMCLVNKFFLNPIKPVENETKIKEALNNNFVHPLGPTQLYRSTTQGHPPLYVTHHSMVPTIQWHPLTLYVSELF